MWILRDRGEWRGSECGERKNAGETPALPRLARVVLEAGAGRSKPAPTSRRARSRHWGVVLEVEGAGGGGGDWGRFAEEAFEVEAAGVHGEIAFDVVGPEIARAIPVEFDAVVVGIAEVDGFADAVVGGAFERDFCGEDAAKSGGEFGARGVDDRGVVEAGGAGGRRIAAETFPRVEADVMVVAAGGEECGGVAHALHDLQAEHAGVELDGAFEVGDLEMDVADAHAGMGDVGLAWIDRCSGTNSCESILLLLVLRRPASQVAVRGRAGGAGLVDATLRREYGRRVGASVTPQSAASVGAMSAGVTSRKYSPGWMP